MSEGLFQGVSLCNSACLYVLGGGGWEMGAWMCGSGWQLVGLCGRGGGFDSQQVKWGFIYSVFFSFLFVSCLLLSFLSFLLMHQIPIFSSFHLFIFSFWHIFILAYWHISYFQNPSPLHNVACFTTMFHRTAGCMTWVSDFWGDECA
jgi:hypothetical protein